VKLKTSSATDPLQTTTADFTASAYSLNTSPTTPQPAAPSPTVEAPDKDKSKKEGAPNVRKAS
jgi:hypothetical protein